MVHLDEMPCMFYVGVPYRAHSYPALKWLDLPVLDIIAGGA
jgi:hypothetical protein